MDGLFKKWVELYEAQNVLDRMGVRYLYVPYATYAGNHEITVNWPGYLIFDEETASINPFIRCCIVREKETKEWWFVRVGGQFGNINHKADDRFEKLTGPYDSYEEALMYVVLSRPFLTENFTIVSEIRANPK